jgi:hypothetical protein
VEIRQNDCFAELFLTEINDLYESPLFAYVADTFENLKDEIYKSRKGILSKFVLIPSPSKIRDEARQKLPLPAGQSSFDKELKFLLDTEYKLYKHYTETIVSRFLKNTTTYCEGNPGEFPELDKLTEMLLQKGNETEKVLEMIPEHLGDAIRILQISILNGGKTRAGSSLEKSLEFLLEAHGFEKGLHFGVQIEIHGDDSVVMDFIFPADPLYWQTNPHFTVTTACMTTVNDRKRLAKAQVQKNTQRRLLCALGTEAHAKMIDVLTTHSLDDLQNNSIKVTVIDDVVDHWNGHSAVTNYQTFLNELRNMKVLWDDWYQNKGSHFYDNWKNEKATHERNHAPVGLFEF